MKSGGVDRYPGARLDKVRLMPGHGVRGANHFWAKYSRWWMILEVRCPENTRIL